MADKRTMTLNLTDQEMSLLEDLSARKDVSKTALLRQALRLYQMVETRLSRGEKLFFELLQETPGDNSSEDTRFRVRLAFFRYLPPETRIRLLERRRAYLEDRLGTIDVSLRATREQADDYTLALMEHGRSATESDIAWLESLIRAERDRNGFSPGEGRERRAATLRRKEHTS